MARKIKGNNLAEQAYSLLKQDIQSGRLVPEQRVIERVLTETMAISRTPIRQALQRLEAESYLQRSPSGGYIVRKLMKEDIYHLYCIRIELESLAMSWAVEKCTEPGLKEMEKHLRNMESYSIQNDMKKVAVSNSLFHQTISVMSGSAMLVEIIDSLKERIHSAIYRGLLVPNALNITLREHSEIIDAMRRKDVKDAISLLKKHLKHSMETVLTQF